MSSADSEQGLSPAELAERDHQEKERKAKEAAEQAQLPYKWTQTIRDVDVTAPIPANIKGRDMQVLLTKTKISVAIKGQDAIIEVRRILHIAWRSNQFAEIFFLVALLDLNLGLFNELGYGL